MFAWLVVALLVVTGLVLAVLLARQRNSEEERINSKVKTCVGDAEDRAYRKGFSKAEEEYREKLSRPMTATKLRDGKYLVEYVLQNGQVPLAAVVSRETVIVVDKGDERRTKEAWFVKLPYNRRLTQSIPFILVVDEAGIGYEPFLEPVVPTPEPPKAEEAAA